MEKYQEYLIMGAMVLAIFAIAFTTYFLFFSLLRRLFKKNGWVKRMIASLHKPILFILLGFSVVISFRVLPFYQYVEEPFEHIVLIFVISSVAWLVINLVKSTYNHLLYKYEKSTKTDLIKRSFVTQLHFLYRASLFVIIAISLASILMTFPAIRSIGVGILGSAGIVGIALGIAARPILLNFIAGFQIAITRTIKIGDTVIVEGEWGWIERIHLTHVVVKIWDLRRLIVPISQFIDKPFQNWSVNSTDLIGTVYFYADYTVPVEEIRKKLREIIEASPLWDRNSWGLVVTDANDKCLQLRATVSARNSSDAWNLRCYVREQLLDYLQKNHPDTLPKIRRDNP